MSSILSLTPEEAATDIEQLAELLIDAVDSGASVGFMPPLSRSAAVTYWTSVIDAMREGTRILLVALNGNLIQGSVQIGLEMRENGNHRAEVLKLFVHRRARRHGLAKALLAEVEAKSHQLGRTLFIMDTRKGAEMARVRELAREFCAGMEDKVVFLQ